MEILSNIGDFLWFTWEAVIYSHKEAFEMVVNFPYCENNGVGSAIFDAFLGIIMALYLLSIDFFVIYGIYTLFHWLVTLFHWLVIVIRTKEIREKIVEGVVTEKEHEKEHCDVMYNVALNIPITIDTDEKYHVYVKYDGLEAVFDNKKLYKGTKKNQKIDLLLVERIDRRGRVIKRTLELPE